MFVQAASGGTLSLRELAQKNGPKNVPKVHFFVVFNSSLFPRKGQQVLSVLSNSPKSSRQTGLKAKRP